VDRGPQFAQATVAPPSLVVLRRANLRPGFVLKAIGG
jgi:hypothetical protein